MDGTAESSRPGASDPARLELTARRFDAIVASSPDAIICIDVSGRITLFSPGAERVFGYRSDEVLGENVSMLMPSPYRDEHDDYLLRYRETHVAKAIGRIRNVFGRRKDGEVFPIELSVQEARVGDEVTYAAILRDVSERAEAAEAIRLSQARFDAFMDNAPVVAFIKDEEGRYLYVNRAFESFFDVALREIAGKTDAELQPPDVAASLRRNDAEVLVHGRTVDVVETVVAQKGRIHEWLALRFPIEVAPGRIVLGGMALDMTATRSVERRLRLQFEIVRVLTLGGGVERMPQVLAAMADGLQFAAAEYWRFDEQQRDLALTASWYAPGFEAPSAPDGGRATRFSEGVGLPGRVLKQGTVLLSPDVTEDPRFARVQEKAKAPLRGCCALPVKADDRVLGVIVLFRPEPLQRDEDLRKVLEILGAQIGEFVKREAAEREVAALRGDAERRSRLSELGAMVARIVHDLGNPLAGMRLQAQLLARAAQRLANVELIEPAEHLLSELDHLMRLLADLKDFARSQRVEPETLHAASFLREATQPWVASAEARGTRIEFDVPDDMTIHVDREKMRRVVENLVKNAIEADEKGRVAVRARRGARGVRITVEDEGPGIPEGVAVFRLFETTKPGGSGLGLPIARELVEAHGGTLQHERRPKKGTAFHIDLPVEVSRTRERVQQGA